ncbi:MAG: ATP-binding cassette domain-containing protein [Bacteroidales bacterium]|jgi:ABC-type lipoprotein export system ATPase subunit|nr:ATP-binding cassette domain-containing protein [Bacteroidales bacterium]
METIHIDQVLPYFISDTDQTVSDIWSGEASFRKGQYYLITAESGAGKSSLLSYMFGERSDYTGNILFDHQKIDSIDPQEWNKIRQKNISFVFQGLRLFSELTAYENIAIKNRLTNHKTDGEIAQMLAMAGLSEKINEKTGKLSFGQQQRLAIIRSLCQPFDFLLMDEPFSHLDDTNIEIMHRLIVHETEQQNAGLVICSLGPKYPFSYHYCWKL